MLIDHNARRVVGCVTAPWRHALGQYERHATKAPREAFSQFRPMRERAENAMTYYLELVTRPDSMPSQAWRTRQALQNVIAAAMPLAHLAARDIETGPVSKDVAAVVARLVPEEAKRLKEMLDSQGEENEHET